MPELPEAETIVRGLRRAVVDETIRAARIHKPDVLRDAPTRFRAGVRDRRIEGIGRRGKNVLLELDGGWVVAVNLGMTGQLLPFRAPPGAAERPTHPAVTFSFAGGGVLVFDDVRRFGTVECLSPVAWAERSGRMGPEPLSRGYTAAAMEKALAASRSPARSWLLDQRRIAGVGNIYACEALFLAGIHPRTPAREAVDRAAELHRGVRRVLRQAIRAGGTTIRDYRDATGAEGRYARRLLVYGREGEACVRCGSTVERIVFGGRSAFLCPSCQAR